MFFHWGIFRCRTFTPCRLRCQRLPVRTQLTPPLCKGRWVAEWRLGGVDRQNSQSRAFLMTAFVPINPSVSFADSSLYTREPFRWLPRHCAFALLFRARASCSRDWRSEGSAGAHPLRRFHPRLVQLILVAGFPFGPQYRCHTQRHRKVKESNP